MSIFAKQNEANKPKTLEVIDDDPSGKPSRLPLPGETPAPARDRRQKSVIQSDLVITGNLTTTGILEFCGQITGDLSADTLFVTEDGRINGKVSTKHITVSGTLTGNLVAEDATFKSKSATKADIQCERVSVEAGAMIDGHMTCRPKRLNRD